MTNLLVRSLNDDSGATAVEYGLITAGISRKRSVLAIGLVSVAAASLNAVDTDEVERIPKGRCPRGPLGRSRC